MKLKIRIYPEPFLRRAILLRLLLLLSAFIILTSCGGSEERKYRIGVSQCSQDEWRDKVNQEILREAMAHDNVEVEIRSANDNSAEQIADIRYFAEHDFDLIIVAPNETEMLTPVIEKVYDSGIPVIIFDRCIDSDKYTARIEGDNVGLGVSVARYARARSGNRKLNFLELTGLHNSSPAVKRHEGFISEIASMPDAEVSASVDGLWNRDRALQLTDSLLRLHPEINVVYAHNDFMATGAAEAARRLGRNDIMIIGIDGTPEVGIKAVADSVIDATFIYPTDGYRLIRRAVEILNKSPFNKDEIIPATSAVDNSNAELLLQQSHRFNEENNSIPMLNRRLEDVRSRHHNQTNYLYLTIGAILILLGLLYLLVMSLRRRRRLHAMVEEQNRQLATERDKQKDLYHQLELATQSKLNFFTNISHDLRTPLTLIADPVEKLAEADYLRPDDHQLMKIANKNVKVLRRLINQILDFRKYENGHLELVPSEIDPGATLREWCQSFLPLAKQRHINLEIDTDDADGVIMAVDPEKLERILFNLMSNAFRHTRPQGTISVKAGTTDNNLFLSISDTGCGIPPEEIPKIFDRFHQVAGAELSDAASAGSGIGLAVTKAFVELHHGTIEVESFPGKGSTFTVKIPINRLPQQDDSSMQKTTDSPAVKQEFENLSEAVTPYSPDADTPATPEGAGNNEPRTSSMDKESEKRGDEDSPRPLLLIVEDNIDMQQLLRLALEDEYEIITAADGVEGVRKARKYIPDIVISDVMMPRMDGFRFCASIKEEVATSHIPVMLLTACAFDEQRIMGYSEGADSYLPKPFNTEVLRARCLNLIQNRRRIRNAFELAPFRNEKRTPAIARLSDNFPKGNEPSELDSDFYRRFLTIVQDNIGNSELGIGDIASKFGLGNSQFGRKIKALTGQPPVTLIRSIRLHHARSLLLTTEKSISEIAYEVGFTSPAYFSKSYLELFGQTPTATRTNPE